MSHGVPNAEGSLFAEGALDRAVVRILAGPAGQRRRGTGTLVAPGLVLTAFHVVGERFEDPPRPVPQGTIDLLFVKAGIEAKATLVDGCFDPDADWALLRCEPVPDIVPAPIATLGSGERGPDARFWTFGFPEENRREGLPYDGHVADPATRYAGSGDGPRKPKAAPAILLRADAARGDDIAGLSGGPCFVGGALVGVIRSTLTDQDELSKGHIYACPLDAVLDKVGSRLPLPDPYRGLPGLPHRPLPARPFRYLERYTEADAEIFFGRGREVRELYEILLSEDSPPIALFFGQTGVGKSSVLDAGLVPRLRAYREPVYVRRDAARGLLGTLQRALRRAAGGVESAPGGAAAEGAAPASLWREVERAVGRPLVVILDQVEEAYTRPRAPGPSAPGSPAGAHEPGNTGAHEPGNTELDELAAYLAAVFDGGAARPAGRLLLSFRKEWLAEVQARLEARPLPFRKVPLWRLREDGIEDIVRGLSRTARIRSRWGAAVDPDLPRVIRDDLLSDPESPVAPTLQIVMTRLFEEADRRSPGKPALTKALYDELRRRGLLFKDFIPQQVALVAERQREHVESGLVDDLLEHHTTASETAAEHPIETLKKRYAHVGPDEESGARTVAALVEELKAAKLLSEGALRPPEEARPHEPAEESDERTCLAHDTLAPLVRARFAGSGLPGQRARRLLESRAVEWRDGAEGRPLDDGDLDLVKRGLRGMRAVSTDERRLIDASEAARTAREEAARAQADAARRAKRNLGLGGLVLGVAALLGGVVLYYQDELRTQEEARRKRAEAMADAEQLLRRADKALRPSDALPFLCRAIEVLPADDARLDRVVARAVQAAVEAPVVSIDLSGFLAASGRTTDLRRIVRAAVSDGGRKVLVTLTDGTLWLVPVDPGAISSGAIVGPARKLDQPVATASGPGLSPDGRWVGAFKAAPPPSPGSDPEADPPPPDPVLVLWEPEASPAPRTLQLTPGPHTFLAYWSDDSRTIFGADFAAFSRDRALVPVPLAVHAADWAAAPAPARDAASGAAAAPRDACHHAASPDGSYAATLEKAPDLRGRPPPDSLTAYDLRVAPAGTSRSEDTWSARILSRDHVRRPCLRDVSPGGRRVLVGSAGDRHPGADELLSEPMVIVDREPPRVTLLEHPGTWPVLDRGDMLCTIGPDVSARPRLVSGGDAGSDVATCTNEHVRTFWYARSPSPSRRPVEVRDLLAHRADLASGVVVGVTRTGQLQVSSARSPSVDRALGGPAHHAALTPDATLLTVATRQAPERGLILRSFSRAAAPPRVRPIPDATGPLTVSRDGGRALVWGREGATLLDLMSGESQLPWPADPLPFKLDGRQVTRATLPEDGSPILLYEHVRPHVGGAGEVVSRDASGRTTRVPLWSTRPFFTGDGRFVVGLDSAGRSTDPPAFGLTGLKDPTARAAVRMPTSVGHVLLATLLATSSRVEVLSPWPEESQITMRLSGGAFAQIVTTAGVTSVFASVPAPPEPSGGQAPGVPSTAPVPTGGAATIPPAPRTTPLVFSSHPAEGPGAFCFVQAPPVGGPRSGERGDVPLLAYVSAEREGGVRPTAPWVPVVVEDLTNGSTLATFHSTEVKAMAFSPDCERLHVVGEDGVERSWFVMHRYNGDKPSWVSHLSSLVTGRKIDRDATGQEATRAVPALTGPLRAQLLSEVRAARDKGDPAAAYVWQHWFGPDEPR